MTKSLLKSSRVLCKAILFADEITLYMYASSNDVVDLYAKY